MERHLLVDGYNVLHAWGWIHGTGVAALAEGRERLARAVRAVRDAEDLRVTIVFDGRGAHAEVDPAWVDERFAVIFAPAGATADSVIERLVATSPEPAACTTVTVDLAERETVSAAGGNVILPEDLAAWVERSVGRVRRRASLGSTQSAHGFGNRLPL